MPLSTFTVPTRSGAELLLVGERTSNPHLIVAPATGTTARDDATPEFLGGWAVTHLPTGHHIPGPLDTRNSVHDTRRWAEALAHLDWSFQDPQHFKTEAGAPMLAEVMDIFRSTSLITASDDERPPEEGGSDVYGRLPKTAAGAIPDALAQAQKAWDLWMKGSTGNRDDRHAEMYEAPEGDNKIGMPTPLWHARMWAALESFASVYLYASLDRLDREAADSVTTWLARQFESGDTVGEWLWQWQDEHRRGVPLTLHGCPSPAPAEVLEPIATGVSS